MSFKLLGINGSLTPPTSSTRSVLDVALAAASAYDSTVETEVLELRDFALEFCDGRSPDNYNSDTKRALALVEEADAYLVATPSIVDHIPGRSRTFSTSYPTIQRGMIHCAAKL